MNAFSIGDMGQSQDVQNPLIVSSGLVGYWGCNDGSGSIVRDFSGNRNDGNLTGSILPRWTPGPRGGALWFSGSTNCLGNIPDITSLRPGSGSWTIVCSFNAPGVNQASAFVQKRNPTTFNQMAMGIGRDNGSGTTLQTKQVFVFTYSASGFGFNGWHTGRGVADDKWHQAVMIRPSTEAPSIYIDGQFCPVVMGGTLNFHNINNTFPWTISPTVSSSIDDIRFYNRALTGAEVTTLYQASGITNDIGTDVATDWASRVVGNGGAAPSAGTKTALATFYNGLISNGLILKMRTVNCLVPDSLIAAITPLINMELDPWTNNGFVSGDLTANGLIGNASSKYLRMCNSVSSLFLGSTFGITLYVHTARTAGTYDAGYTTYTGDKQLGMNISGSGGIAAIYGWETATGPSVYVPAPYTASGYFSGNRTSTTDLRMFFANSTKPHAQIGNTATGSMTQVKQASPMYLFTTYIIDSAGTFGHTNSRISFAALHDGLTASESAAFYNLIQTMRTSLGGGYV